MSITWTGIKANLPYSAANNKTQDDAVVGQQNTFWATGPGYGNYTALVKLWDSVGKLVATVPISGNPDSSAAPAPVRFISDLTTYSISVDVLTGTIPQDDATGILATLIGGATKRYPSAQPTTASDGQSVQSPVPVGAPWFHSDPSTSSGKANGDIWMDAAGRQQYQIAGMSIPTRGLLANTNQATSTLANTTTETQIATYTVPAAIWAYLIANRIPLHTWIMAGINFGASGSTLTVREKWNGVEVSESVIRGNLSGGPTFAAAQNRPLDIWGQIKRESGSVSTPSLRTHTDWASSFTGTTKFGAHNEFSYGQITVSGTVDIVVTITAQWSAADSTLYFDHLQVHI